MNVFKLLKQKTGNGFCAPCAIGAVILAIVAMAAIGLVLRTGGSPQSVAEEPLSQNSIDAIVQHGQILLTERLNAGEDLSDGPCLDDNKTFSGWVIDIAHSPRIDADDDPKNQCSAYRNGKAKNFIELSASGDVIQIFPKLNDSTSE